MRSRTREGEDLKHEKAATDGSLGGGGGRPNVSSVLEITKRRSKLARLSGGTRSPGTRSRILWCIHR